MIGHTRRQESSYSRDSHDITHGVVFEVYPQKRTMSVLVHGMDRLTHDVQMASSYIGPGGGVSFMAERGATAVLIKVDNIGYVPVAYLPPTDENYRIIDTLSGDTGSVSEDEQQRRFMAVKVRRLAPGSGHISGLGGAEVHVDRDVEISDANMNYIRMRAGSGTLVRVSPNTHSLGAGLRESSGFAVRNAINDYASTTSQYQDFFPVINSDGSRSVYIGGDPDIGYAYTEYRREMTSQVNGDPSIPDDVTDEVDLRVDRSYDHLYFEGNLIGADPADVEHYGRILRPVVFDGANPASPDAVAILAMGSEANAHGAQYGHIMPGRHFDVVDKEGVRLEHYGRSTYAGTLGLSRSVTYDGGLRENIGQDQNGMSVDMRASGSVVWKLGHRSRSTGNGDDYGWDVLAEGRVRMSYDGFNPDSKRPSIIDYASGAVLAPDELDNFSGVYGYKNGLRVDIGGDSEVFAKGSGSRHYGGSYFHRSKSYMGSYGSEYVVSANMFKLFAVQSYALSTANHRLVVAGGLTSNSVEDIQGSKSVTALMGMDIKSLSYKATLGSSYDVIAATTSHKATSHEFIGSVDAKGVDFKVSMASSFDVKSSTASIVAPSVVLGFSPVRSNVLTTLTAPCFITGLLSPGSTQVQASS